MVTFAGCVCSSEPVTETAYVPVVLHPIELAACVLHQDCEQLCRVVFPIGDREIDACGVVSLDGVELAAWDGALSTPEDLRPLHTARVQVTYVPDACSDDSSATDAAGAGAIDDGSADDGASDDGSMDDGPTDDGSTDDGSTDDGSTDGGSTDDGSTDDGSTDDGASPRHAPPPAAKHIVGRPAVRA